MSEPLPPLPEPDKWPWLESGNFSFKPAPETSADAPLYTADQLRAAVAAERERCAKLCEAEKCLDTSDLRDVAYNTALKDAAAAIRNS